MTVSDIDALTEEAKQDLASGAYWTPRQLAEQLSFSTIYIQILCGKGIIKALRYRHRWRIPKTEVKRVLKEGIKPPPHEPQSIPVEQLTVDSEGKKLIETEIEKPWWQKEIRLW